MTHVVAVNPNIPSPARHDMEAAQVFLRLDCDHHTPFILMLSGETNVPYASPMMATCISANSRDCAANPLVGWKQTL